MSDSSALQSALTTLFQNNYATVTIVTAVGYDYVLTFSNEVEYIWSQPWGWVSTLFIFVRYFGLCNFLISAFVGSSFIPGPAKLYFQGEILDIVNEWVFVLFLGAADIVMILRVWAMYNRSRLILGALLILFSAEIIATVLAVAVDSDPNKLPAATVQILDFSICVLQATEPMWTNVAVILQITHNAALCLLAVVQVTIQSLQMYRVTKQWQLNRYMGLLVKQGILSFFAVFLFNLINVLSTQDITPTGWRAILLVILEYVPIYTLTPRFILSMRVLYAHDVRGRREGIDTAFGLSRSGETTPMAFAGAGPDETLEDGEEIPMEAGTPRAI